MFTKLGIVIETLSIQCLCVYLVFENPQVARDILNDLMTSDFKQDRKFFWSRGWNDIGV